MTATFGGRTRGFTESVIRGMSALAREHGAINLAQGFPDFPAPDVLKEAAARAIGDDVNQYAITWGSRRLREALARKYAEWYGMAVNPETRDHRHLRLHRGDGRDASWRSWIRATRSSSSSRSTRTTAPTRSSAAPRLRHVPLPIGANRSTSSGLRAGVLAADPGDHRQHAGQPHRPGAARASELERDRGALPALRRLGRHRRDLRAHPLRRAARPHGDAAGHGGAHHHHQRRVEDLRVTGWRIGWAIAPAGRDRRDPEGARLPHRRGARAAHGGGGGGARPARRRVLLAGSPASTAAAATCSTTRCSSPGFRASRPGGRLLHPRRLLGAERTARRPNSRAGSPPRSASRRCPAPASSARPTPRVGSCASPSASARTPCSRPPSG